MSPITNATDGLAYLTMPGGPLARLAATVPASTLESASPQDLVSLSAAALQTQMVAGLYRTSPSDPAAVAALPGLATTDAFNDTAQQQASVDYQSLQLQMLQGIYGAPVTATGTLNTTG